MRARLIRATKLAIVTAVLVTIFPLAEIAAAQNVICTDPFHLTKPQTIKKAAKADALKFCQETFPDFVPGTVRVDFKFFGLDTNGWQGTFICCGEVEAP